MSISNEKNQRQPILMVTGASGSLGHWICRMAISEWSVWGIHWQHQPDISGIKAVQADLTDAQELKKLFFAIKPHAVIHAAAASQPALCEADPRSTFGINVDVPELLAALCAEKGIPYIFTSTDLVFNGLNAPYDERSPVSPVNAYGRQKAQAEAAILKRYPEALVCRMPLMFGLGPRVSGNFSLQMLSAIKKGRTIRLFTDEFRTPVDFKSAAMGLLKMLGRSQGLLHLGGRSRISRFELGLLMARQMDIATSMLEPVSIDALAFAVVRPPDCTMKSNAAYALGYDPLPLPEAVQQFVDQFNMNTRRNL